MRTALLAVLASIQLILVVALMRAASSPTVMEVAALEAPALVSLDEDAPEASSIVDTIHVFSGIPENGNEGEGDKLRRGLAYDGGNFAWVMLEDRAGPRDGLRRLVASTLAGEESRKFDAALDDGFLSFFYDLGSRDEALDVNWTAVGQVELQDSPLLAWAKRVDFMVVSRYDEAHCGGLRRMLEGDPAVPIVGPPLGMTRLPGKTTPSALAISVTSLMEQKRLSTLPVGLVSLAPRLQAFTYAVPRSQEDWNAYAMALVIRGKRGWAVYAGCAGVAPDALVVQVERALRQPIVTYVGATGYEGASEDPAAEAALESLHRSHPDLEMVPTCATSFTTHAMISRIFGADRYRAGVLGARIHL